MKSKVSYRIRKLRESKDFSQENMAADLNITTSAYSKIERGVTDPSIGRLEQIAKILGVELTYFFHDFGDPSKLEDSGNAYGFAKIGDLEELNHIVKQLKQEVEKLKKEMAALNSANRNLRKKK